MKDSKLTAREIQVVGLLAHGLTNKAIADILYLEPSTIKTHLTRIGKKLGIVPDDNHNLRIRIVVRAVELGYKISWAVGDAKLAAPYGLKALRDDLLAATMLFVNSNDFDRALRQRAVSTFRDLIEQIDHYEPR